eukprot:scaffold118872_cov36-Cyclotella_meneghiniana.AAC.1
MLCHVDVWLAACFWKNIETKKTTNVDSGDEVCKSKGSSLTLNDTAEKENPKFEGNSGSLNNSIIDEPKFADAFHGSALALNEVLKDETKEIAKLAFKLDKTGNIGLDFKEGTDDTMIDDFKTEVAKAFNAASEVPDTSGDAGLEVNNGADDMLKNTTLETVMISKAGDATLYDSKMEAAVAFRAAFEVPDSTGDAGLEVNNGAVAMLKDRRSEIAMIAEAGDATLYDSKTEAANGAASEVPDTTGNAGLEVFDGAVAMLKDTALETVMISKAGDTITLNVSKMEVVKSFNAASEVPDTTGEAGLKVGDGAVAMLKDIPLEIAMISKASDATLDDSKIEVAKSFNAASEVPDTTGNAGLEVNNGAVAMLKDRTSEIAMISKAGDATLNDSKTEVAKSFNAASDVPDSTGNAGLEVFSGADVMLKNRMSEIAMIAKAGETAKTAIELHGTAGNVGLDFVEGGDAKLKDAEAEIAKAAIECHDTASNAGSGFDEGADLKDTVTGIANIAKADDTTLNVSKMDVANAASDVYDTAGNAGLDFYEGADAALKDAETESAKTAIKLHGTAGNVGLDFVDGADAKLKVAEIEIAKAAIERHDTASNVGSGFDEGTDATFNDIVEEFGEDTKAHSELDDSAGGDGFLTDDGTVKAASPSPSTGPFPSISSNKSVGVLGGFKFSIMEKIAAKGEGGSGEKQEMNVIEAAGDHGSFGEGGGGLGRNLYSNKEVVDQSGGENGAYGDSKQLNLVDENTNVEGHLNKAAPAERVDERGIINPNYGGLGDSKSAIKEEAAVADVEMNAPALVENSNNSLRLKRNFRLGPLKLLFNLLILCSFVRFIHTSAAEIQGPGKQEFKLDTSLDELKGLRGNKHSKNSDIGVIENVKKLIFSLSKSLGSIQHHYKEGNVEEAGKALKAVVHDVDGGKFVKEIEGVQGMERDLPEFFTKDDIISSTGGTISLKDIPNSMLGKLIHPEVVDQFVELSQDFAEKLEDIDLSLLEDVSSKQKIRLNSSSRRYKSQSPPMNKHQTAFDFKNAHFDATSFFQMNSEFNSGKTGGFSNFMKTSSLKSIQKQMKVKQRGFSLPKLSTRVTVSDYETIMSKHRLRQEAMGAVCLPECDISDEACNCRKLFECVKKLDSYDMAALTAGGFIDTTAGSKDYGKFGIGAEDLNLYNLDGGIEKTLQEVQEQVESSDPNDNEQCNNVLE